MNTLDTASITDPLGKVSECIRFTIDTLERPFMLNDIMAVGYQYTFSLWLMTEADSSISVSGKTFASANAWEKHFVTFTAEDTTLLINFNQTGIYYVYHPQLEIGNKVTDWTPALEDVDANIQNAQSTADAAQSNVVDAQSAIRQLADSISTLVTDANGTSLMQQTSGGWTFSIAQIQETLDAATGSIDDLNGDVSNTKAAVDNLKNAIDDLGILANYVRITVAGNEPVIELGSSANSYTVRITNTEIQFADGSIIPTRITRQMMLIEKALVRLELQFGDETGDGVNGVWIMKRRVSGNLGISWKGVS